MAPPEAAAAEASAPRAARPAKTRRWRVLLRDLHRDAGYLIAGLTIAYAASGVAVNHIDAWNPKYEIETVQVAIGALPAGDLGAREAAVVAALALDPGDVRGRFAPDANHFTVFLDEGGEVKLDARTGKGTHKRVSPRRPLYEFHLLHLNTLKGAWTWVADIFGVLLAFLAVSGVLLPRGRQGLAGRGGLLLVLGLAAPALALWAFYSRA